MTLKAVRPFKLRLHGRVQFIAPGETIELENEDAERLLQKAPDRVSKIDSSGEVPLVVEPVEKLRPVYWESTYRIVGPGEVLCIADDGGEFWLCVELRGSIHWIRDYLLRSQDAYDRQARDFL